MGTSVASPPCNAGAHRRKWSRGNTYRLVEALSDLVATKPVKTLMKVPLATSTAQRTPQPRGDGEPSGFWCRKSCSGRKVPRAVTLQRSMYVAD